MISKAVIASLSDEVKVAIAEREIQNDKFMRCAVNSDRIVKIAKEVKRLYPNIVRHPQGKAAFKVLVYSFIEEPDIIIHCCVANFADIAPIVKILEQYDYKQYEKPVDNKYSISREFIYTKEKYGLTYIKIIAFALKDLGADCRVVEIGYEPMSKLAPIFRIVCDELEEKAIKKQDTQWAI